MDYAKIGEGYGLKSYTCRTIQELVDALEDAKKQTVACLFDLKVIPKTMTDGYESWWNVGNGPGIRKGEREKSLG